MCIGGEEGGEKNQLDLASHKQDLSIATGMMTTSDPMAQARKFRDAIFTLKEECACAKVISSFDCSL